MAEREPTKTPIRMLSKVAKTESRTVTLIRLRISGPMSSAVLMPRPKSPCSILPSQRPYCTGMGSLSPSFCFWNSVLLIDSSSLRPL